MCRSSYDSVGCIYFAVQQMVNVGVWDFADDTCCNSTDRVDVFASTSRCAQMLLNMVVSGGPVCTGLFMHLGHPQQGPWAGGGGVGTFTQTKTAEGPICGLELQS